MPIEVGLWNISSNKAQRIEYSSINSERRLEDILTDDISILDEDLLLIGRQVPTIFGKYIDLLAINKDGKLTIIELKRDRAPREVIAQILDYASWVKDLSYDDVKNYCQDYHEMDFESLFAEKFGIAPPEMINQEHNMLIVCSELDNETERILNYLSDNYYVPINAVFFRFFTDLGSDYLTRSWLIDPVKVEEKSSNSRFQNKGEGWNGRDFVVNIDEYDGISTWEDSIKYGFISAGRGKWYHQTLNNLFPGARVFAMLPKRGYLGVGEVLANSVPITDFFVLEGEKGVPILDVPLKCETIKEYSDDPKMCEYLVRVRWITTSPEDQPYWEKGLSANQNSAFKLRNKFTLDRLTKHFGLDD
ncbi:endonuclease NucS domain-containing protein [Methanoculleus horonobensis]|uniref:endonuclease NucS domain-containing protein n=1 Tax=Methanoculleus horonobensis TaxID=528314 RepID=UPI000A047025|nr:endonuclease NucS domain-containing protein [Methanoculleus horonobensis]